MARSTRFDAPMTPYGMRSIPGGILPPPTPLDNRPPGGYIGGVTLGNMGNPGPYEEAANRTGLRASIANYLMSGGLQNALAGLANVPRGANFGSAFLAGAGGAAKASSDAQDAAMKYALAKQTQDEAGQKQADLETYRQMMLDNNKANAKGLNDRFLQQQQNEDARLQKSIDAANTRTDKEIQAGKDKAAAGAAATADELPTLDQLKGRTASGHDYIDVSQLTQKQKGPMVQQAYAAGLVPVDKAGIQSLGVIDKARSTLNSQLATIQPFLAKTAGGRVANYPNVKLGQIFQTNPDLGAYSAWRDGAIQALQGLAAGGTGMRIQQAAINNMIAALPQSTDTWATAQRKVQIIQGMIDNAERPIISRNWQAKGQPSGTPAPAAAVPDLSKYVR